jgi:hypothetical protein
VRIIIAIALSVAAAAAQDPAVLAGATIANQEPLAFIPARGRHSPVFRGITGKSAFNLHSYLAHHDGRFWAIWSSAAANEEDPDQQVVYATSTDGHTWTEPRVLARDPDGPTGPARWIARGLFLHNGRLTALAAYQESANYGKRGSEVVWKNLRLMHYQWENNEWRDKGVFAPDCMNNFPPQTLGARLAMICRDRNMDVSVALLDDPARLTWKRTPLAADPPFHRMDEPTWYQDPNGTVHMIVRDNTRSRKLIRALSRDGGVTWTRPVLTNYPDATSKNFTGRLSNGLYFLINNPNPNGRDPLTIAFSRDGWTFDNPRNIRARSGSSTRPTSATLRWPSSRWPTSAAIPRPCWTTPHNSPPRVGSRWPRAAPAPSTAPARGNTSSTCTATLRGSKTSSGPCGRPAWWMRIATDSWCDTQPAPTATPGPNPESSRPIPTVPATAAGSPEAYSPSTAS